MVDRALPLDDDEIGAFVRGVEHELFGGARREIGNDAIDRNPPSCNDDTSLTGRHESSVPSRCACGRNELECDRHLTDRAIVADREKDRRLHLVSVAGKKRNLGRLADIPDRRACGPRGASKLAIDSEYFVQAADDLEFRGDCLRDGCAPIGWKAAALGRRSDEQRRRSVFQRLRDAADDGNVAVEVRKYVANAPAGVRRVDHRHHLVTSVANHAVRRLGIVLEAIWSENCVTSPHRNAPSRTPSPGASGISTLPAS